MFIVKNETKTGLILMAPFLYRRALQMRYIGLYKKSLSQQKEVLSPPLQVGIISQVLFSSIAAR